MAKINLVTIADAIAAGIVPGPRATQGRADREKIAATTESEIRKHAEEDGNALPKGAVLRRRVRRT